MSRVANTPVELPSGVEVKMSGQDISVKGGKGELAMVVHNDVEVIQEENLLKVTARNDDKGVDALAGTMRALVANMVVGVPMVSNAVSSCKAWAIELKYGVRRSICKSGFLIRLSMRCRKGSLRRHPARRKL